MSSSICDYYALATIWRKYLLSAEKYLFVRTSPPLKFYQAKKKKEILAFNQDGEMEYTDLWYKFVFKTTLLSFCDV